MAEEFGDNLENLQKEMSNLIITGIIDGKIDEENQCLYLKKGVNTNQIIMQSYNTINGAQYDQKANVFIYYCYCCYFFLFILFFSSFFFFSSFSLHFFSLLCYIYLLNRFTKSKYMKDN